MPKTAPAEWLLARITTTDRAAAIYGDLTELATARGRVWFWTAYVRALAALGWRTAFAFLVGGTSLTVLYLLIRIPVEWRTASHPYIHESVFFLALQLWFLVPFTIARYGWRDRLARSGVFALLITTGVILSAPYLSSFFAVAGMVAIAVSLIYESWRRPLITLLATTAVGAITLLNLLFLAHMACWIDEHKPLNASSHYHFFEVGFAFSHTLFWVVMWSMAVLDMMVLAFVCSSMHRWLPEHPESTNPDTQLASSSST